MPITRKIILKSAEIIGNKIIKPAEVKFEVEYADHKNGRIIVHIVEFNGHHAETNKNNFLADFTQHRYNVNNLIIKHKGQLIK